MRPHLEAEAAQRDIADLVEFTGWLPFEQIPDEMRSADLFVLPSIVEGMPLVLLQAMACGLPVIATEVSGSVDLVQQGRNGVLVPAKDPAALAEALTALLDDRSLCSQMGARSREIALTMDWSEIARSYSALYQAVLSAHTAKTSTCKV